MEDQEMALLNEPGVPTRRGNSASRDAVPELPWLAGSATWRNEGVDLGSDHSILRVTIKGPRIRAALGKARITGWYRMRKWAEKADETPRKKRRTLTKGRTRSGRKSKSHNR